MRTYPVNEDCPLSDEEKKALEKLLDELEWKAVRPFKHLTSTYTESKVDGYDEREIEVTITWGVDGQWEDFDYITIDRNKLNGKSES